ncbi:MAG: archease [Pseudomonadota bacterium]
MTAESGAIAHTADLGLWVSADSLPELFSAAAVALAELMVKGPRDGELTWLPLELTAGDYAELLVELLGEVVYRWDGEGLLCVALEISELRPASLRGRLGVMARRDAHRPGEPVKAVTYHQARVEPAGSGWRGQVILDV